MHIIKCVRKYANYLQDVIPTILIHLKQSQRTLIILILLIHLQQSQLTLIILILLQQS
ncbi:hypothetical protein HanRHA438_Chr06g0247461 [Helianthus annuus]|nr:hypothetical protein HanIR_Chr06g0256031 [Helianthus annuus]KAJ0909988.1 hypothetical protein HanRHA438_Chr06g0247461 [Helianthus annuus]